MVLDVKFHSKRHWAVADAAEKLLRGFVLVDVRQNGRQAGAEANAPPV